MRVLWVSLVALVAALSPGCSGPAPTAARSSPARAGLGPVLDPYLNVDWSGSATQSLAGYGDSLASGDVNGDGYDDVVVGAPGYDDDQADEGEVLLYLGSSTGVDPVPAWTAHSDQSGALFGSAVAAADLNADGFADIVVGAPAYSGGQSGEGRAYVYEGAAAGPAATPSWTAEPNVAGADFGAALADAGDTNGDGFTDLLIGAPSLGSGQNGEGRAYLYRGSATGPALVPQWTADGNQALAALGQAVAGAGDVNGDGYADVVVGVPLLTGSLSKSGGAWVYHGGAAGLGLSAAWAVEGDEAFRAYGSTVAGAGDVNGDGYDDLLVGGFDDEPVADGGRVALYLGSAAGLAPTEAWTWLGGVGDRLAVAAGAGDVDADGYADVVVGGSAATRDASWEGVAYLYRGTPSGIDALPAWTGRGGSPGASFGGAFAAGDLDADGRSDVIVGAAGYAGGVEGAGAARAYRGGCVGNTQDTDADGVPDACDGCPGVDDLVYDVDHDGACAPAVAGGALDCGPTNAELYPGAPEVCDGLDGACDGSIPADEVDTDADGRSLCDGDYDEDDDPMFIAAWSVSADADSGFTGLAVAGAGDVDGDGYGDVLVASIDGASLYLGTGAGPGLAASWSVADGSVVSGAGDVNGDGYADVLIGDPAYSVGEGRVSLYAGGPTGLDGVAAWSAELHRAGAAFGASLAAAGDVDGDGYDDVLVGAPGFSGGEASEGRAFLYPGTAAGLDLSPAWMVESDSPYANLGASVASAGDVNGDGYPDVAVAARNASNPEPSEGRVEVYLGGAAGLGASPAWAIEGDVPHFVLGSVVAGLGDVNGDGYDDLLVTTYGSNAVITGGGEGRVYLGSAVGLALLPAWTVYGDAMNGHLGLAAAGVGDTDGDGLAEIVLAAPDVDHGEIGEGRVHVYRGAVDGPADEPAWTAEGDGADVHFGGAVAGAGDVNGDGLADLIVGATGVDGEHVDQGLAVVYLGQLGSDADGDGVVDRMDLCPGVDDAAFDVDGDGVCAAGADEGPVDCDDGDATVYPGAPERCDGLDNACAGAVPADEADHDLDGVWACAGDCADDDATVYPEALEQCDGVDNTCDGEVDEACADEAVPADGSCGCDGGTGPATVLLPALVVVLRRRVRAGGGGARSR